MLFDLRCGLVVLGLQLDDVRVLVVDADRLQVRLAHGGRLQFLRADRHLLAAQRRVLRLVRSDAVVLVHLNDLEHHDLLAVQHLLRLRIEREMERLRVQRTLVHAEARQVALLIFVLLFVVDQLVVLVRAQLTVRVLVRVRIVQREVTHQVALVTERLRTVRALVRLLLRLRRNVFGVMVQILVSLQQLLLSERLLALVAQERLLIGVDQHVRLEVTRRNACIITEVAFEALLALVRLQVLLERVAIWKRLVAALANQRLLGGVQLLYMNTEIGLAAAGGRAHRAFEDRLVAAVDQTMRFQRVALGESRLAHFALVGFLCVLVKRQTVKSMVNRIDRKKLRDFKTTHA